MSANTSTIRRRLLLAMFILAIGALMLHLRVHPPLKVLGDGSVRAVFPNVTAGLLGILDVLLVTVLFLHRSTAVYGYLLNGMLVIFGTVIMTHFGWAHVAAGAPWYDYVVYPTLPDVVIAWCDFLSGSILFALWQKE